MGARNPHTTSGAYEFRIYRAYIIHVTTDKFMAIRIHPKN